MADHLVLCRLLRGETKHLALVLALVVPLFSQTSERPGVSAFRMYPPEGAASLLIGTVHVPPASLRRRAASVIDGARSFVIEHTTHDEVPDGFDPEALAGMVNNDCPRTLGAWT